LRESPVERAAALFNLALVTPTDARVSPLREAHAIFAEHRAFSAAASAARELGTTLLDAADVDSAAAALRESKELAERAGDTAALAAAANALGLALLASGLIDEAIVELSSAAAAHPRSLRPHEHAAAKANLALAYRQAGDARHALLAARQALGVPGVPPAVERQAQATLAEVSDVRLELVRMLDDDAALLRDELARWADAPDEELRRSLAEWTEPEDDHAELLLGGLLELPPEAMERILSALAAAGGREQLERVSARFHAPQELRVREVLARWN
jgi:tetratricopeptide (TPR) repeat protein